MTTALFADSESSQPPAAQEALVREVTAETFMQDVIEESLSRLVLVDFWAPWCGPCKQLAPLLEKLVMAQKGAVILAKVNIDVSPEIAQQLRVQSVPTVFAFSQRQPVDGFMGAQSESQLKSWIEKLIKTTGAKAPGQEDYTEALSQADAFLASGDIETARALYDDIFREAPSNAEAFAGLLRCLIAVGDTDGAAAKLAVAPEELTQNKALARVRLALELANEAAKAGDLASLENRLNENPNDHQVRFDLALAFYAAGNRERAVDELLDIVRRDRKWQEDAARKQLVKLFEAFGPTDPLTIDARRRLSSVLFS